MAATTTTTAATTRCDFVDGCCNVDPTGGELEPEVLVTDPKNSKPLIYYYEAEGQHGIGPERLVVDYSVLEEHAKELDERQIGAINGVLHGMGMMKKMYVIFGEHHRGVKRQRLLGPDGLMAQLLEKCFQGNEIYLLEIRGHPVPHSVLLAITDYPISHLRIRVNARALAELVKETKKPFAETRHLDVCFVSTLPDDEQKELEAKLRESRPGVTFMRAECPEYPQITAMEARLAAARERLAEADLFDADFHRRDVADLEQQLERLKKDAGPQSPAIEEALVAVRENLRTNSEYMRLLRASQLQAAASYREAVVQKVGVEPALARLTEEEFMQAIATHQARESPKGGEG